LRLVTREREVAGFAPSILPVLYESARAYLDWLFGGRDAALRVLARWLMRPSSEIALRRVTVLREGETPVGTFVALAGAELAACRKADAFGLLSEADGPARGALLERLRAVGDLFAPVGVDDWYLSKLGVVAAERRRGLGRHLLEAYVDCGKRAGCSRYRLDVDAGNTAAINLYESYGFSVLHDATSTPAGIRYLGMAMEA
jgi:ribosomal protein S18 acetylase RimI-like enzyme